MYLLRVGAAATEASLRPNASPQPVPKRSSDTAVANVFLICGTEKAPKWIGELGEIADVDEGAFIGQSVGAVVLVERQNRVAVITFGTGFHAVEPSLIERGFGLRVTANIVATNRVRGAQTRGVASNSRDQITLLPVDGEFSELNVEVDEDWLRQLSGKSADKGSATSLAGSDSLRITVPEFSLKSIGEKVDQVLALYAGEQYKNNFPFLDQITPIDRSDPVIEVLDKVVVEQLRRKDTSLAFAAPDPFEQLDLDHYELTCGRNGRFALDDLDPAGVFKIIDEIQADKNPLNDIHVYALDADDNFVDRVHPLKAYLQTEASHDGINYLLSAGLWFVIRNDFVAQVNAQIVLIPDISAKLDLPRWNVTELRDDPSDKTAEGSYNKLLAKARDYALLDKQLVYFGPREKLEISDLLTPDGELLCVKAASSSPTLSHLVAQAIDSAAAWGDPKYQEILTAAWKQLHGSDTQPIERTQATFVLAIATSKPGPLSESLFFFTKVQIASCLRLITRAGFHLALARIEMDAIEPTKMERRRKKSIPVE